MTFGKIDLKFLNNVSSSLDLPAAPEANTSALGGAVVKIAPLRDHFGSQIDFVHEVSGYSYLPTTNAKLQPTMEISF